MRKTFLFVLICLMSVNVVAKSAVRVLPQDFALKLAMKECSDSLGKYDYYIGECYEKINGANYYYFFVDMLPEAGWEHPCKHVYINISGVTSQNPAIVKDDKRPLGNKTLKPIHVKNRYGANSKKKPHVKKNNSLSPVELKCASHTYAVILSGGINKDSNDETYWNDCSFIYQTLRHHYGVPKENMKVIMSDGKDPGLDMKTCDHEYISSPLDLDEDGVDDVEYAATKENVRKVFEDLASKLTEEDHLFLYVIDHGGIKNKKAYICLWNDETLYPDELNESLNAVNAGYISILMGQCYSGGFVEPLKADNRIIMAACGENEMSFGCEELPFDEFVYHWTSAMNEATPYGEEVYADTNGDGIVSMGEAFAYAELNDAYSMGKFFCVEENPINARKANVMYDELGFSNIPPVGYDLYISDNENDTGKRPYDPYLRTVTFPQIKIWDNMSLWTRNQNDGFTNTEMQNVTFEENDVAYLYAKITNRGTKPYVFDNENPLYLYFYWTSAAFAITTKDWKGIVDQETDDEGKDKVFGGKIGSKKIRETIAPGESCIIMREWAPDEDTVLEDIRKEPDFHACFLAGISKNRSNLAMPSGETEGMVDIKGSNKLAQKNVQVFNPHKPNAATVRLGRLFSEKDSCRLCLMDVTDKKIFENTEISLTLSPDMMTAWTEQGCSGRNINVVGTNTKRIIFKDENSSLSNIFVGRKNRDKVTFNFNKLVNSGVKTFGNQRLDFALVGKNGEILGGETFIVKDMEKASVSNATIPDNIFSAPSGSRSNLQYISLCRSIRFIGANAFANSSLRMIELPNGIISIGRNAFAGCTELKEISISRMSFHAENIFGDKYLEILNVPVNAKVNYQNDACWKGISEIKEKEGLFNTFVVTAGGDKPLEEMLGEAMLTTDSLVLKGFVSAADYNTVCKAIAIGRLCSVDMSDCDVEGGKVPGATYSSEKARYWPHRLRYFRFPKNTTSIKGSFKKAYLFDFNIPSTVKKLPRRFFEWCTFADKLVIPEGVEKLDMEVFLDATLPHDVVLPSTLCEVGEASLHIMETPDKLLNVYFNRMYPPANGESPEDGPFGGWDGCMPKSWTLYVPVGAKKYFAADKYWGKFPNIVETPELDGGTSGIDAAEVETTAADKELKIYTLDGRYVGKDMDRLGKGVYVVGGRKVVR